MPSIMANHVFRRQIDLGGNNGNDDQQIDWWYSDQAFIIKWVVLGVIFFLFLVFVIGGSVHARRRIKKGLPPLRYQKYLISRRQRTQYFPGTLVGGTAYHQPHRFNQAAPHYGQSYPMQPWGPAPPAYQEPDYVPPYAPPPGSSKVNPDQEWTAPPGPPPAAAFATHDNRRGAALTTREVVPGSELDDGWESSRVYSPAGPSANIK